MRVSVRQWAALAAAGVVTACPALSAAQSIHPGEQRGLGLTGPQVPDVLKAVAADPYKPPAAPACETIPAEILALDQVLGPDLGDPQQARKSYMVSYAERMAGGAIRGLVPYRGAIRFLTGADHKDHELMDAARAGYARRGFLRGLEAHLDCAPAKAVVAEIAPEPAPGVTVASAQAARIPAVFEAPVRFDPEPAVQPQAAPSGGQLDLAAVMLGEPAKPGSDTPGR